MMLVPALLQSFFTERLTTQCQASPNTIAAYRDTFRLLLPLAAAQLQKSPDELSVADLDASFICKFLSHVETERHCSASTRNARLSAIRAFFRYVMLKEPAAALICQQVLAIPQKRAEKKPVHFLDRTETTALLDAPDASTWSGERDRVLLTVAVETGLRVSELIGLRCQDVGLGTGPHVTCVAKGRKHRTAPLSKQTAALLQGWLRKRGAPPTDPLFPSIRGGFLSRDAVERLVAKHVSTAIQRGCASLKAKRVSPHTLRHTVAMDLLHHGVDHVTIALYLGHQSPRSTEPYLHADLDLKQRALARLTPHGLKAGRFRPTPDILAFLEGL